MKTAKKSYHPDIPQILPCMPFLIIRVVAFRMCYKVKGIKMHSHSSEDVFSSQKKKKCSSCGLLDFHDFIFKSLWTHTVLCAYYNCITLIYVLECGSPELFTFHKELVVCPTVPAAGGTWKIAAFLFSDVCMNKQEGNH